MIIDTHVHLIKPYDSKGRRQAYTPNPASAEDYIALMDQSGIDRAFFISWSSEDIPSDLSGKGIASETVRETLSLDYALEVMDRFTNRFYWFPCHLGPAIADHLSTARKNLQRGAVGLKLVPSFWGELPDDPRLIPIYDLADEFDARVIIDTSFWYLGKDDPRDPTDLPEGHREVARRVTDFQDYSHHLAAVFTAYPNINFSLAHASARSLTPERAAEVGTFIAAYPNVFADLAAVCLDSPILETLVRTAGPGRIMFGTDYPHFAQGPQMTALIDIIRSRLGSPTADLILGNNALSFLGTR